MLAELKQGPRSETIAATQAEVDDLEQQVKREELRLNRMEKLVQSNAVAQQDYEQSLYTYRAMTAKVETARSRLDELLAGTRQERIDAQQALVRSMEAELQLVQHQLDDCELRAPFDGMIVQRFLDPGTVISPGTPVFDLMDHQHLEIHVGLPFEIASAMTVNNEYPFRFGEQHFTATLRTVLPLIDPATQTQKGIFDFQASNTQRPVSGQNVRVQIDHAISERGFWIPERAVASDQRGLWSCFTVKEEANDTNGQASAIHTGTLQRQAIEVLYQADNRLYVRGTLPNGSLLVCDGVHRVVDQQEVQYQLMDSPHQTSSEQIGPEQIGSE